MVEIRYDKGSRVGTNIWPILEHWKQKYGADSVRDELLEGMGDEFIRVCLTQPDKFIPYVWQGYKPFGEVLDPHNVQTLVWRTVRKGREAGIINPARTMKDIGRRFAELSSADVVTHKKILAKVVRSRVLVLEEIEKHGADHNTFLDISAPVVSPRMAELYLDYIERDTGNRPLGIDHLADHFTVGSVLASDGLLGDGLSMMAARQRIFQGDIADILFSHLMYTGRRIDDFSFEDDGLYIGGRKVGSYVDRVTGAGEIDLPRKPTQETLDQMCALERGKNYKILLTRPDENYRTVIINEGESIDVDGVRLLEEKCIYGAERSIVDLALPKSTLFSFLRAQWRRVNYGVAYGEMMRRDTEMRETLDELAAAYGQLEGTTVRLEEEKIRAESASASAIEYAEREQEAAALAETRLKTIRDLSRHTSHEIRNSLVPALEEISRTLGGLDSVLARVDDKARIYLQKKAINGDGVDQGVLSDLIERERGYLSTVIGTDDEIVAFQNYEGRDGVLFDEFDFSDIYLALREAQRACAPSLQKIDDEITALISGLGDDVSRAETSGDYSKLELSQRIVLLSELNSTRKELSDTLTNVLRLRRDQIKKAIGYTNVLNALATDPGVLEEYRQRGTYDLLKDLVEPGLTELRRVYQGVQVYTEGILQDDVLSCNGPFMVSALESTTLNAGYYVDHRMRTEPSDDHGIYIWVADSAKGQTVYVGNTGDPVSNPEIVFKDGVSTKDGSGTDLYLTREKLRLTDCDLVLVDADEINELVQQSPYDVQMNTIFGVNLFK